MAGIAVCKDCNGSFKITLLTSTVDCDCVKGDKNYSNNKGGPQDFDPNKTNLRNGWYSAKMESRYGAVIYALAGSGQEVRATIATQSKTHNTRWDDIEFIGVVDEYVREGK